MERFLIEIGLFVKEKDAKKEKTTPGVSRRQEAKPFYLTSLKGRVELSLR